MAIRMTRVDPSKNMARWYEIDVQPTLFGEYTVERHWGRIGAVGQSKSFWFDDEVAAEQMAKSVATTKARRGYVDTPIVIPNERLRPLNRRIPTISPRGRW